MFQCSMCQSSENGDWYILTHCAHVFHVLCKGDWTSEEGAKCPVCQMPTFPSIELRIAKSPLMGETGFPVCEKRGGRSLDASERERREAGKRHACSSSCSSSRRLGVEGGGVKRAVEKRESIFESGNLAMERGVKREAGKGAATEDVKGRGAIQGHPSRRGTKDLALSSGKEVKPGDGKCLFGGARAPEKHPPTAPVKHPSPVIATPSALGMVGRGVYAALMQLRQNERDAESHSPTASGIGRHDTPGHLASDHSKEKEKSRFSSVAKSSSKTAVIRSDGSADGDNNSHERKTR